MEKRFIIGGAASLALALPSSGLSVSVVSEEEIAAQETARREARKQLRKECEEAARRAHYGVTSKYAPHQGAREMERRRKRAALASRNAAENAKGRLESRPSGARFSGPLPEGHEAYARSEGDGPALATMPQTQGDDNAGSAAE